MWHLRESRLARHVVLPLLYFAQGVPMGVTFTLLPNMLLDLGHPAGSVGAMLSVFGLPWALQFCWGPLVDLVTPFHLARRLGWIWVAQLGAVASIGSLAFVEDPLLQVSAVVVLTLIHNVFASLQDAAVDALAIDVCPIAELGSLNAAMRLGRLAGQAFAAVGLVLVITWYGYRTAMAVQAVVLLAVFVLSLCISHTCPQVSPVAPVLQVPLRILRGFFTRDSLLMLVPVLVAYAVFIPGFRLMDVWALGEGGWEHAQLTALQGSYGMLAGAVGAILGGIACRRWSGDSALVLATGLLASLFIFTSTSGQWWLSTTRTTVVIVAAIGLQTLFFIPLSAVFMKLTQPGVEGTQYAIYTALTNAAEVVGLAMLGPVNKMLSPQTSSAIAAVLLMLCALTLVVRHAYPTMPPVESRG